MTLPEDLPNQEASSKPEENFLPEEPVLPEGFSSFGEPLSLPPARRRRRVRRYFVTPGDDERSALVEKLARRAFPSFEFFLFALLCGAILGAGYLLDSQALLLLGILLAPLMTPWVGMLIGAITGSWRFFFQTILALLTACVLLFGTGALAGLAGRLWPKRTLFQTNIQSHFWWPNFFILVLGAVLLVYSFIRSEDKPILPSVMFAYELLLPLSAAGFGLGSGTPHVWPDGVWVFLAYLALASLAGGAVLAALHFKPSSGFGFVLPVLVGLASLAGVVILTGLGGLVLGIAPGHAELTPTPTQTVQALPSVTASVLQSPTASSPSFTSTPIPSATITPTPSSTATPSYAVIAAAVGGGALLRSEPGIGARVDTLQNGVIVEVLPDIQSVGGNNWAHVRTLNGIEGWVLQSVLKATAAPPPTLTPTFTPSSTP